MKDPNKVLKSLTLLVTLLASSCSSINTPTKLPAPNMSPVPSHTNTGLPTQSPDLTHLTIHCAEILDAPPENMELRNSLVLSLSNTASKGYIFNLETQGRISLGIEPGNLDLVISPNMQKIAFINYETEELVITDADGKELETIQGFNGYFSLIEWLDNENLAIDKANDEGPSLYNHSLLVYNTVTGAKNEFHIEDFPNAKNDYRYHGVFLNAQLTRLIYFVEGNTISASGYDGSPVVLWDVQSGSETSRIYFSDSFLWSSDGTKLLVIAPLRFDEFVNFSDDLPYKGGDEVFIINNKGEMERLTYLTTKHEIGLSIASSWSPTERHIVLNTYNKNNPDFGLSILNINTGEITNYCIHNYWGGVFWSPDEKQIAFTQWDGSNSSKPNVYILDLKRKLAFKIAGDAILAGWLINK